METTTLCPNYNDPLLWQLIRKYTQSNYTIYKVNDCADNICVVGLKDTRGNNVDVFSEKAPLQSLQARCCCLTEMCNKLQMMFHVKTKYVQYK